LQKIDKLSGNISLPSACIASSSVNRVDTTLILTTIRVPKLLLGYVDNLKKHNHDEVEFIIIGDHKTPHKANQKLAEKITNEGYNAQYWDVLKQKKWLSRFKELDKMVPWNSDCRRNIGYLLAYEQGAEIIITLDDDNHVTADDYFGMHGIVGTTKIFRTPFSANKWFNPCLLLKVYPNRNIYPRGFPYCRRDSDALSWNHSAGSIVLNIGLWLNHPDVDAITNLNQTVRVTDFNSEQVMLAPGTYTPINTQNTAFHRRVLPAYYYLPMGVSIHGQVLDRFGDIWSGLFVKKVIDKMDDRVAIGKPLTIHNRNPHDLLKDLQRETWGIIVTERLVPLIESINLDGKTYPDVYIDLAEKLGKLDFHPNKAVKKYFEKVTLAMKTWVEICEKL